MGALGEVTGERLQLDFEVVAREPATGESSVAAQGNASGHRRAPVAQHPMVQRAISSSGPSPNGWTIRRLNDS